MLDKDYHDICPDRAQVHGGAQHGGVQHGEVQHGGAQHDDQGHPIRGTSLVPQFYNPEVQEHKNGWEVGGSGGVLQHNVGQGGLGHDGELG